MTADQLHDILDDKDRKLTLSELKQVIYDLCTDSLNSNNAAVRRLDREQARFYQGEQNAFRIALDLLEHLEV